MFKKIVFACLVVLPQVTLATEADDGVNPAAVKLFDTLAPAVMLARDVTTGIDIGGCDAAGAPDNRGSEQCVRIFSHTAEGVAAFKVLYPQGTKVDGVYISVQYMPRAQAH